MPDLIATLLIVGVGAALLASSRVKGLKASGKAALLTLGVLGLFAGGIVYVSGVTLIQPLAIAGVPQPSGAVASFDSRISAFSVATITGSTNVIKPDGSSVTLFDTVALFSTNNGWTMTVTFAVTNLNQGIGGTQNTWQATAKIASADQLASVASPYPYLVNRTTSDPTQWDITYAGTDFASKATIRDVHYFGDTYGKASTFTAATKGNAPDLAKMVVGVPYCIHWQVAGAPLDQCALATA